VKDLYNREIDYLRISVTDKCNFRCLYCKPSDMEDIEHNDILTNEEIIEIVKEAVKAGIKKVRITGGEPMVRKDLYRLIEQINQFDEIKEIVLTTNASLLKGNVKKLKDVGIKRVNISIDTFKNQTFKDITNANKRIDYVSVMDELKEHKLLPIKVNCVLLKGINDDEILDFYALSKEKDIQVRFIELMPFESNAFRYEDYYISKDDILQKYPGFHFSHKSNNVEYYTYENHKATIGFINAISEKFCESCNRLRLTSDGYLKPCLHSSKEINIRNKKNEELLNSIKTAIKEKPEDHSLDKDYKKQSKRTMNKIGG
jgi:cyclic pyranopterin phosphate synthase